MGFLCDGIFWMEYFTAKEIAERLGMTTRRVQSLCKQGKIYGVTRLGNAWAIPKDAEKPADGRYRRPKEDREGEK